MIESATAKASISSSSSNKQIPYRLLAAVIQKNEEIAQDSSGERPTILELTKSISKLASNQQTFKGLDGVAHEAYQRTHSGDDVTDTSVSGRAQRSAARLAAVTEALYACELVELAEHPELLSPDDNGDEGILPHNAST